MFVAEVMFHEGTVQGVLGWLPQGLFLTWKRLQRGCLLPVVFTQLGDPGKGEVSFF